MKTYPSIRTRCVGIRNDTNGQPRCKRWVLWPAEVCWQHRDQDPGRPWRP